MDRFQELRVVLAIAGAGSLARAAAALHSSPPAVTRTLSAVEDRLGVRLFERTTRRLRITEPGTRFLENARRILADLDAAELDVTGQAKIATGALTMTASLTFGRAVLRPIASGFLEANPRVNVSLLLFDRVVDLVEEGFDLAVRIGHLPDSSMMSRHVGEVRRLLVASPDYLSKRGIPSHPEDLKLHSIISQSALMPNGEWRYWRGGKPARIALPARFEINDAHACIAAAEEGQGITIALSYMVNSALRQGKLVSILAPFTPPPIPVSLVWPQRRMTVPKVRAFIEHAAPRLHARLLDLQH